jgi:hypothetical protein
MSRTAEEIAQAYKGCLDGADTINVVIATHAKGSDATDADYGYDMTHDEKKELNVVLVISSIRRH